MLPIRPFLKWPGGKFRLSHRIIEALAAGRRLVEPFAGSGAVFLNSHYPRYLLADSNPDLIGLYRILKREGAAFIDACDSLFTETTNQADAYYALRDEFNACSDVNRRAQLFVYLNRHCYNGLCRYNQKGGFNSPFGRYKQPRLPHKSMLGFHRKLKQASLKQQDFATTLRSARDGDVVYCDPPYAPLSRTANFTSYDRQPFDWKLQERLAQEAQKLAMRGIPVVISNHDTAEIRSLYSGAARIDSFAVSRMISCKGDSRHPARELLAIYTPESSATGAISL